MTVDACVTVSHPRHRSLPGIEPVAALMSVVLQRILPMTAGSAHPMEPVGLFRWPPRSSPGSGRRSDQMVGSSGRSGR